MTGFRSLSVGALFLLALGALSCGSSRQLQSVNVQPAQATANGSPVQFSATGSFSKPPSPQTLTSKDVTWCYGGVANSANPTAGICAGNVAQLVSVDSNGVAQCNAGFRGVGLILAGVPSGTPMPDAGQQLKVYGSATLTCP